MTNTGKRIEFAPATRKAPQEVCDRARGFFELLLKDLREIADENAFWDSMQLSMLEHSESGWSFLYRFNGHMLSVYDVRRS